MLLIILEELAALGTRQDGKAHPLSSSCSSLQGFTSKMDDFSDLLHYYVVL